MMLLTLYLQCTICNVALCYGIELYCAAILCQIAGLFLSLFLDMVG